MYTAKNVTFLCRKTQYLPYVKTQKPSYLGCYFFSGILKMEHYSFKRNKNKLMEINKNTDRKKSAY